MAVVYEYPYSDERGNFRWATINGAPVKVYEKKGSKEKEETKTTKETIKETAPKSNTPVKEYKQAFHLEAPVNDFDEANNYLKSDDMTQYVPEELKDVITSAEWELDDEESGFVKIQTNRALDKNETKILQDWIDGQNSDGLGEGFEQQDFAISYFDPETGDGPFTYAEYEREIQRQYDELDPSEYADYLDENVVDGTVENIMETEGYDADDPDAWEEVRQEVYDNPEEYLDWQDIDNAKDDYFKTNGYSEDDWYAMSSMKRTDDGFEETDINASIPKEIEDRARELQFKLDGSSTPVSRKEYEEYQKLANEYDIKDMTNNGGPFIDSLKTTPYEEYLEGYSPNELKETLKADVIKDAGIEKGSREESMLNQIYEESEPEDDTDWSRYDEFLDDLKNNRNKNMNYEEWLKTAPSTLEKDYPISTARDGSKYIRSSHPYDETEYSYAREYEDGSWEVLDPTKTVNGNRQIHRYDTVEEAREKMAEIDARIKGDTSNTGKNYEGVSYNNYEKERVNEAVVDHRKQASLDTLKREQAVDNIKKGFENVDDKTARNYEKRLENTNTKYFDTEAEAENAYERDLQFYENFRTGLKDEFGVDTELPDPANYKVKTKEKYLNRSEMMDVIDKWSSEGFREGKYKSDYGLGVFHNKYASGNLEGYGGEEDDFVIRGFDLGSAPEKEALEDLNDMLQEYGYEAKYLKDGTVHQDIEIKKVKATPKSMNDTLRRKGYEKYLKEHPNSKMTFEDYMKKNKK